MLLTSCQTNNTANDTQINTANDTQINEAKPEGPKGYVVLGYDWTSESTTKKILDRYDKHKITYLFYSQTNKELIWTFENTDIDVKAKIEELNNKYLFNDIELLRVYRIEGIEKKDIPYFVKNYPKLPEVAMAKKTCIDIGYKSSDEDFKTCVSKLSSVTLIVAM